MLHYTYWDASYLFCLNLEVFYLEQRNIEKQEHITEDHFLFEPKSRNKNFNQKSIWSHFRNIFLHRKYLYYKYESFLNIYIHSEKKIDQKKYIC